MGERETRQASSNGICPQSLSYVPGTFTPQPELLCVTSLPRHHVHLCRRNRPLLSLLSQGTTGKQLVLNKCSVMSSVDSPAGPRPASGGRCQDHGLSHWVCAGIWGKAGVGTLQAAGTGPDRQAVDSLQAGSLVVQGKGVWMSAKC